MAELRPVAGPSSPVQRHIRRLVIVVVVGLVVAIAKPWGSGTGLATVRAPVPSATATPSAAPSVGASAGIRDFLRFGTNEPPPAWELWPAGSLASFTYAMRIDMSVAGQPPGAGSAGVGSGVDASAAPPTLTPGASGSPPAAGGTAADGVPADWPVIRVARGNVLDLVGINRPLGYVVRVTSATRTEDDGTTVPVRVVFATSPWPDHFTTLGYAPRATEDELAPWPTGHYRLELTIDPGTIRRVLEIVVEASPVDEASPAPASAAPSDSTAP